MTDPVYFRLCHSSFVREYGDMAYICNQLTRHDRVYDSAGGVFLREIKRVPRTLDEASTNICKRFGTCNPTEVRADFQEFLSDLESDLFIVTGQTPSALDIAEPRLRYGSGMVNYKETTHSFWNPDTEPWLQSSQTLLQQHFALHPTLVDFQIELTAKCNERCRHCYLPPAREMVSLPSATISRVLNEFADMGGITITFSGGEPLLHHDLPTFLKQARNNDLSIALLSNATLLNEPILAAIVEANISLFQVSIYSLNPDEHDFITRLPGSLHKSLASIEKLIEADVPVQISCPVMSTNYHSYADVLRWANDKGMKAYTDYIMVARSDLTTDNLAERLDEQQLRELISVIVRHDMDYQEEADEAARRAMRRLAPSRDPEDQVCGVARSTLCLSALGTYYPCSCWRGLSVGDANSQSLSEVWHNSPELDRLRKITWESFPKCLQCADFDFCAMCLARNFNEGNGDMFKVNEHFCMAARMNKTIVDEYNAEKKRKAANCRG